MGHKATGHEDVGWIHAAQNGVCWQNVVSTAMKPAVQ
jgi:hypothetical protein